MCDVLCYEFVCSLNVSAAPAAGRVCNICKHLCEHHDNTITDNGIMSLFLKEMER